jgi:hypothetical protein
VQRNALHSKKCHAFLEQEILKEFLCFLHKKLLCNFFVLTERNQLLESFLKRVGLLFLGIL